MSKYTRGLPGCEALSASMAFPFGPPLPPGDVGPDNATNKTAAPTKPSTGYCHSSASTDDNHSGSSILFQKLSFVLFDSMIHLIR
mmetsp:Transcript_22077/g.71428  ORF Transcript_22077/g.71428 Transcript_22077/m.71428 type:complete len:85 (-) Transcript_22077:584-838(-)